MKITQIVNKSLLAFAFLSLFAMANAYSYDSSLIGRGEERGGERGQEMRHEGQFGHEGGYGGSHPEARGAARGFEAGQASGGAGGGNNQQEVSPFYVNPNQGPQVNINVPQ